MKRSEIRALADEAYAVLDDSSCEAAVERALQVLAHAPNDPESFLLMSEIAEESERLDQALVWLDRGLIDHPHHEGLLLKKAAILIDGFEDIDEGFAILSGMRERFGDKSMAELKRDIGANLLLDIYLLLTDCYRLKNDYRQALAHALLTKEIAPFDENALLSLATAHFELGEYKEAKQMIEPIDERNEPSDYYWLKAQILCAEGQFAEADGAFLKAYKLDKIRYHRPIRLSPTCFITAFDQALLGLPREIRDFVQANAIEIHEVIPVDLIKESQGKMSPMACITIEKVRDNDAERSRNLVSIFQKNIENLAARKEEIKDLIASALLHELGKLV